MKRIAIIGSPGTGKTTFARQFAEQIDVPLIHLDYYYHDKQYNHGTDKEAWRARADSFTEADSWIIDGNFGATMAKRLERADTIFYFNMPTYVALIGIIKRWLTAHRSDRPEMPDDWQEKPSFSFFWKVLWFRYRYARSTQQLLAQNTDKTIVTFKNHKQIAIYLENLATKDKSSSSEL
jgi:adenylate kinase family enzyme